ncbi:hypothetical protein LXL04_000924 [Taraxacum kok-saghyz]
MTLLGGLGNCVLKLGVGYLLGDDSNSGLPEPGKEEARINDHSAEPDCQDTDITLFLSMEVPIKRFWYTPLERSRSADSENIFFDKSDVSNFVLQILKLPSRTPIPDICSPIPPERVIKKAPISNYTVFV